MASTSSDAGRLRRLENAVRWREMEIQRKDIEIMVRILPRCFEFQLTGL